jgi:TolA-binding protein
VFRGVKAMRSHLLGLILMAGVAAPAIAQQPSSIDRRVAKLEQELRAVQRRVFPGGNVEPEITTGTPAGTPAGLPATGAVADLNARVDALEAQLATLTGQAEANENRVRQVEAAMTRLRDTLEQRLAALERADAPPAAATAIVTPPIPPARTRPVPASTPTTASASRTEDAEEAYNAGFRLWEQKRYAEAQQALEAMARKYPQHRLASWAKNLAGRAYLDEGKPATAARAFLANYQDNPRGERAADSLFFLGQALFKLNKAADACKAYDELQDVYGQTMRAYLKERLPGARAEARCR